MVVAKDYGGRVERQRAFDDFPRIDRGTVDRAPEQLLTGDHPVPGIEKQAAERLMPQCGQPGLKAARGIGRLAETAPSVRRAFDAASAEFERRLDPGDPCSADAPPANRSGVVCQPVQAATGPEQFSGQVESVPAPVAAADQQGQYLRIRQLQGAGALQALAGGSEAPATAGRHSPPSMVTTGSATKHSGCTGR